MRRPIGTRRCRCATPRCWRVESDSTQDRCRHGRHCSGRRSVQRGRRCTAAARKPARCVRQARGMLCTVQVLRRPHRKLLRAFAESAVARKARRRDEQPGIGAGLCRGILRRQLHQLTAQRQRCQRIALSRGARPQGQRRLPRGSRWNPTYQRRALRRPRRGHLRLQHPAELPFGDRDTLPCGAGQQGTRQGGIAFLIVEAEIGERGTVTRDCPTLEHVKRRARVGRNALVPGNQRIQPVAGRRHRPGRLDAHPVGSRDRRLRRNAGDRNEVRGQINEAGVLGHGRFESPPLADKAHAA